MFILEDVCNVTPEEDNIITTDVLSSYFSWFYNEVTTSTKYPMYCHPLMVRLQNNVTDLPEEGNVISNAYEFFYTIFKRFCDEHNIKVNKVYRGCLNATFYHPDGVGDFHEDHTFPHYNFVLHLTDATGGTRISDGINTITVTPEKYKAVIFDGKSHAQEFCKPSERRVVCVFTFSKN